MKHFLFLMISIMLCNHIDILATQKNQTEENSGSNDFISQQLYNLLTSPEFFKNPKKWDGAKIICFKCNHITTADKLWAHAMAYTKEELLQELLSIFNNGSTEDLALFTLKAYQEHQIKCSNCFQYNGYYIAQ